MKRPIHERNESWTDYRAELQRYEKNLKERIGEAKDPKAARALIIERDLTVTEMKKVAERQKSEAREPQHERPPGALEKAGGEVRRGLERQAQREINNALRGLFR